MNIEDKTKQELINELKELQQKYDSLKFSIKTDFSKSEHTEEALHKCRKLLKSMEETAKIGGWEFDVESNKQIWTDEVFHILEIDTTHGAPDVPEGIGFIAPEYQPMALLGIQRAIEFGEPYNQEWQVITAKGNKCWINAIATPYQENGKTISISGSFQDITKRKQVEDELKESEERFKNMFERHSSIMLLIEPETGKIIGANEASVMFYGYSKTELLAMRIDEVNMLSVEQIKIEREKAIHEERNYFVFPHRLANGELRTVEVHSSPIVLKNQRILFSIIHDITERKLAEITLHESEENLATTLHSIGDGVISTDVNGLIVNMNPVAEKLCGWNLTDALGKPLSEIFKIINSETRQIVADPIVKVLEKGEIVGLANHTVLVSKNGAEYQISDSAAPIKNKEGAITGVVFVFSDVTESYLAQKHIKESQERYGSLLGNLEAGIVVHAPDTAIIMNNHRASELLGLTDDQMRGKAAIDPAWKFIHEDNSLLTLDEYPVNRIATSKQDIKKQILGIVQPNKSDVVWVTVNGFPVLDANGAITEIVISFIDITDHIKSVEKIKLSEAKFSKSFFNSPDSIVINRLDNGKIVSVNNGFRKIMGYEEAEVIGKTTTELNFYKNPEERNAIINALKTTGQAIDIECWFNTKHGEEILGLLSAAIIDIDGVNHIMSTSRDVTERKQIELLLQEKTEEIEVQNEELNQTNQELIAAKEKAEESEEKYRLLFENANEAIYIVQNEKLVFTNPTCEQITGISKENLIGFSILELVDESEKENLSKHHYELINGINQNQNSFFAIFNQKGEKRHLSVNSVLIKWNGLPATLNFGTDISERKQAEEALKASEEKFSNAFYTSPYAITITSPKDGTFIDINDAFTSLTGYTREEAFADSSVGLKLWADINDRNRVISDLKEGIKVAGKELLFRKKNGDIITAMFSAQIIHLNNIPYILSSINDITERKQTEDALKESEERFKALHNASFGGIAIHDKGIILECNQGLSEITGYTYNELIGMDGLLLIAPNSRDLVLNNILSAFEKPYEAFGLRKNGDIYPLRLEARNIPYKGKNVRTVEFRDITESKHAEEKNQLLASILDYSQDFIGLATPDQKAYYVNPAGQKMLGIESDEMARKTKIEEYFFPEDLAFVNNTILPTLIQEGRWAGEFRFRNFKTNEPVYVFYDLFLTADPVSKKIINFSTISRDITAQKKIEQELITAKEHAEESDRLKSAFLANMSHEIRTPMNGILGFAELLKNPDLSGEQQQEFIKIIEKSGVRMLNIINDIVDISKIEAGLMKLDIQDSNINEQIEYIYTFFKPEVEAKGMKLSLKNALSAKVAIIKTDREKLYAILTNLVKNAIKYSKEGKIELGYEKMGEEIEFFVKDTGIGISKDRLNAIFERFIQADIADKMARQGAGLGLSISKAYIEMLGGKIWVESEEGVGSCFYFTLPCKVELLIETNNQHFEPSLKIDKIRELKILIAEDDDVSEMLITINLNEFGKEILKARTGIAAIESCRQNPDIDLVLMDIRMPEMGGYEATQQIREFNKDVIIIAQTAYGLAGDREKAIEAGCNDYIAKPIKKNELIELIQKYFGK